MQRKTFFLPLREISHHSGFFSGRFPIPMDGIFPPCRNFSDHIHFPKAGITGITGVKASFKVGLASKHPFNTGQQMGLAALSFMRPFCRPTFLWFYSWCGELRVDSI
jgi:hypothetical protein